MANKALLVGINKYPDAPLRGCVNDVDDAANLMVERGLFTKNQVRKLVDGRATTAAIRERLEWLVGSAKPGDKLLFWYSGHGTMLPTRSLSGDVVANACAICPVDFDWTPDHALTTSDFAEIFRNIPEGVIFQWVSDSCHSGDLTRAISNGGEYRAPRQYPMPADIAWRKETACSLGIEPKSFDKAMPEGLQGAFISGCQADQTSSDAFLKGKYCGALSAALLERLDTVWQGEPMTVLVEEVHAQLEREKFSQNPQLHGAVDHLMRGWMAGA
jgi:hypothetical protein